MGSPIERLPHRAPFLFVSEVLSADAGAAHCAWNVRGAEEFLKGHFPGRPLVPGVLITEALAQAAGIAVAADPAHANAAGGMLVHADIRFRRPVAPPARIELHASTEGGLGALHRFAVEARVDGAVVAAGQIVLAIQGSDASAQQ